MLVYSVKCTAHLHVASPSTNDVSVILVEHLPGHRWNVDASAVPRASAEDVSSDRRWLGNAFVPARHADPRELKYGLGPLLGVSVCVWYVQEKKDTANPRPPHYNPSSTFLFLCAVYKKRRALLEKKGTAKSASLLIFQIALS